MAQALTGTGPSGGLGIRFAGGPGGGGLDGGATTGREAQTNRALRVLSGETVGSAGAGAARAVGLGGTPFGSLGGSPRAAAQFAQAVGLSPGGFQGLAGAVLGQSARGGRWWSHRCRIRGQGRGLFAGLTGTSAEAARAAIRTGLTAAAAVQAATTNPFNFIGAGGGTSPVIMPEDTGGESLLERLGRGATDVLGQVVAAGDVVARETGPGGAIGLGGGIGGLLGAFGGFGSLAAGLFGSGAGTSVPALTGLTGAWGPLAFLGAGGVGAAAGAVGIAGGAGIVAGTIIQGLFGGGVLGNFGPGEGTIRNLAQQVRNPRTNQPTSTVNNFYPAGTDPGQITGGQLRQQQLGFQQRAGRFVR